jgi:hypothetical protein
LLSTSSGLELRTGVGLIIVIVPEAKDAMWDDSNQKLWLGLRRCSSKLDEQVVYIGNSVALYKTADGDTDKINVKTNITK